MAQRNRGSVVDSVTLAEVVFQYEPKVKTKDTTKYASQHVIGRRLPNQTWVGGGESNVELDITFSDGGSVSTDDLMDQLIAFTEPQPDINAPHPVYINVGDTYLGKQYILVDAERVYTTFAYADTMQTRDAKMKLKFTEITPANSTGL